MLKKMDIPTEHSKAKTETVLKLYIKNNQAKHGKNLLVEKLWPGAWPP